MQASDGQPSRVMASEPRDAHPMAKTVALAFAHVLLFAAAFSGGGLWLMTFVSIAPLAWLAVGARSTTRAVVTVIAVQFLMWLWIDRWISTVTVVGYPLLAAYMSLYAALFVWIIRRIDRHAWLGRWSATLVVPVVWVGLEFLRGALAFDGFPWYLAAHPVIEWLPFAQTADLLGTYFVSFLVVMPAGLLVDAIRARGGRLPLRGLVVACVVTVALHLANLGYGWWRLSQDTVLSEGPTLLIIQTNLPQDNKVAWTIQQQRQDVARFISQTEQAHDEAVQEGTPPDLIIWPETMLPVRGLETETVQKLLDYGSTDEVAFAMSVISLSHDLAVPMLVGVSSYVGLDVSDRHWIWERHYNSAYLILGEPPYQRYDKHFLTPFGETMPYISKWPWLERKLLAVGAKGMRFNLDASPTIKRLRLSWPPRAESSQAPSGLDPQASVTLATPICFEDTVAPVCRKMVYAGGRKTAHLLVNLSNDGWFGSYDAGRHQHAQIARFRCIENRVPMVRAVNTGLSVAIDSGGNLIDSIDGRGGYGTARRRGSLAVSLQLDSRSTLYGRLGDLWAWICLAGTAAFAGWTFVSRPVEPKT